MDPQTWILVFALLFQLFQKCINAFMSGKKPDLTLELEGLQGLLLRPSSEIIAEADMVSKLPPAAESGKLGG